MKYCSKVASKNELFEYNLDLLWRLQRQQTLESCSGRLGNIELEAAGRYAEVLRAGTR